MWHVKYGIALHITLYNTLQMTCIEFQKSVHNNLFTEWNRKLVTKEILLFILQIARVFLQASKKKSLVLVQ